MGTIEDGFRFIVLCVFSGFLGLFCLTACLLALGRYGFSRWTREGVCVFCHMPSPLFLICVVPFVCVLVVRGSTKSGGNERLPFSQMSVPRRTPRLVDTVAREDIARGWRVATSAGAGGLTEIPADAVTNGLLRCRGAFNWAFRVEPDGWYFPYRDGILGGVTVFACGEVRPDVDTLYFPVPPVNGISLLPEAQWRLLNHEGTANVVKASVFRHAVTPKGSLLLDWRNALVGRNPGTPTNLQMELFRDGGFVWRTDGVSQRYLPVFPFDWDNDGLENSVDPEPLVANSADAHGTNGEWYRIVCSNVFELVDGAADWRDGINTNAYYFVDVVAEEVPAPIYFNADRDSRLGSPIVIAQAGMTNLVPLLIGVAYSVSSTVPITVSAPDAMYAVISSHSDGDYAVKWPIDFEFNESFTEQGRSYAVDVMPYDPGGTFTWGGLPAGRAVFMSALSHSPCACSFGVGGMVSFACSEDCDCGGDCAASGIYRLEDALFPVSGGICRCGFDDPPSHEEEPGHHPTDSFSVSICFSKPAVIFEEAYQDRPGVWKPKRSSRVRLTVSAYGGPKGGRLTIETRNLEKLSAVACGPMAFPSSMELGPGDSFYASFLCEGAGESGGAGDIGVSGEFTENDTNEMMSSDASLTVVRVEMRAESEAPANPCRNRHLYGVCERVQCLQRPSSPQITWTALGMGCISNASPVRYVCPMFATSSELSARLGSVVYCPRVRVVEPTGVECRRYGFLPADPMTGVGMALELFLTPSVVSFEGLEMKEVEAPSNATSPEWGVHTGYFAALAFQQRWYHYPLWGAGVWRPVDHENRWGGYDQSRMFGWPTPWTAGNLTWRIPIAWRSKYCPEGVEGRLSAESCSEWTMADDSVSKVKYGQVLTLSKDGEVVLNGERDARGDGR